MFNDVTIVIPTLNEAKNISWVISQCIGFGFKDIIIVDDGDDGLRDVVASIDGVRVIHSFLGPGKGAAIRSGAMSARRKYVIFMDADHSMHPNELATIYHLLQSHAYVKGSRVLGTSSDLTRLRSMGNKFLTHVFNKLYRQNASDLCYGFFGLSTVAFMRLELESTGFEIEAEVATRAAVVGINCFEYDSHERTRHHGHSKLTPIRDGFRILATLIRERPHGRL